MSAVPYQFNQFAPYYFAGLNIDPTLAEEPHQYWYTYNLPVALTSGEFYEDFIPIHADADFVMLGFVVTRPPSGATAEAWSMLVEDDLGYQLFTGYLNAAGISQQISSPTIVHPHRFRKQGQIRLKFQDLNNGTDLFQIQFVGLEMRQKAGGTI